jgi:hypothetical protein
MIKLDPKKLKYLKSDKNSTTLQHKDGHTITVAHAPLSSSMRSQLEALSKVGSENQTNSQAQEAQDQKKRMADGGQATMPQAMNNMYAEGGETIVDTVKNVAKKAQEIYSGDFGKTTRDADKQKQEGPKPYYPKTNYDEGGVVAPNSSTPPGEQSSPQPQQPQQKNSSPVDAIAKVAPMIAMAAEGGEVPQEDSARNAGAGLHDAFVNNPKVKLADEALKKIGQVVSGTPEFLQGLFEGKKEEPKQSVQPESPAAQEQPAPSMVQQPQAAPQQPEADPMADAMLNSQGLMEKGFQHEMAGAQAQRDASVQKAQEQNKALQESMAAQNNAKAAFQQSYGDMERERQGLSHDIQQGYIDPEKYWTGDQNGNGSHSRILTGLGMILAGFNPTNKPNAAIDFLKYQMDQNINAQQQNLNSKNNLLRENINQFKNLRDATDMTRLQQADILQNQMLQAANNAATPQAKAAMLDAIGKLEMSYAPLRQQFAMTQAMVKLANAGNGKDPSDTRAAEHMLGYMRMSNPERAKEMESRLIPGVGMAKIPVPQEARTQITAHQKLDNALSDLDSFTRQHTTLVPGTKEYNVGAQKAMIVQTMLREGLLNTVYREGEQPLLDKLIKGNPGNLLKNYNTLPQIKELRRNNMVQGNALLNQFGLPQKNQTQEAQQDEGTVTGKDGKQYRRMGNYMVPVN